MTLTELLVYLALTWAVGFALGWVVRDVVQVYRDDRFLREYRARHPEGWQS